MFLSGRQVGRSHLRFTLKMLTPLLFLAFIPAITPVSTECNDDNEAVADSEEFIDSHIHEYDWYPYNHIYKTQKWDLHNNIDFKSAVKSLNERNMQNDKYSADIPPWTDCNLVEVEPSHDAPDAFDWADKGVVTPVKDLGNCTTRSYFFSAVASVEYQYVMKHNEPVDLSEQQLLDCDNYLPDLPCPAPRWLDSPIPRFSYSTMIAEGGLMSEHDYPYVGTPQKCRVDSTKIIAKVTGCTEYVVGDEDELKEVLYKNGPLVVGMQFLDYKGGIITDCFPSEPEPMYNTLVGYGTENGTDYWRIKFPFGSQFGESGYVRVQRGRGCLMIGASVLSAVVQ